MRRTILLQLILFLSVSTVHSQTFTETNLGLIKPSNHGFCEWADINNDSFLDLFITGFNLAPHGTGDPDFLHSIIYINDTKGSFYKSEMTHIPRVIYGDNLWEDFNNDGWIDLIVSGTTSGYNYDGLTRLYFNDKGTFIPSGIALPPATYTFLQAINYNNDGWQDLFIAGVDHNDNFYVKVLLNDQGKSFTDTGAQFPALPGFTGLDKTGAIVADFDNDGDPDIIYGHTTNNNFIIKVMENTNGQFNESAHNFIRYAYPKFATADFNEDGILDLVITGTPNGATSYTDAGVAHFAVYLGNGDLTFNFLEKHDYKGTYWGSVVAGDINNDGLSDILINGTGNHNPQTSIYLNGGSSFSKANAGLTGSIFGEATLQDYDNDGDLDIFVIGSTRGYTSSSISKLYRNNTTNINSKPSVPEGLRVIKIDSSLMLTWNESKDPDQSSSSLTYNIRMLDNSMQKILWSGNSTGDSIRQLDKAGNLYLNSFLLPDKGLTDFYWQVQAIDASYVESAFSPLVFFCQTSVGVDVDDHYCWDEEVKLTAEGSNIKWFGDKDLNKLLYNGNNYSFNANSQQYLYVIDEKENCFNDTTELVLNISEQPELDLFVDNEPILIDNLEVVICDTAQLPSITVNTNYPEISFNNIKASNYEISQNQALFVTITDSSQCELSRKLEITTLTSNVKIPNVITPNGDGFNDSFIINSHEKVELYIYNRLGKEIYYTPDYTNDFNGQNSDAGIYYYYAKTGSCLTEVKGWLHVLK